MIYSLKSKWSLILIVLMSKWLTMNSQKSLNKFFKLMKKELEIKILLIFLKAYLIQPNNLFSKISYLLNYRSQKKIQNLNFFKLSHQTIRYNIIRKIIWFIVVIILKAIYKK